MSDLCVTFEYPNRVASQRVMGIVFPARGPLDVLHYTPADAGPRIAVIGESEHHTELGRLRKLLSAEGGFEVHSHDDPPQVHRLRQRREGRRR